MFKYSVIITVKTNSRDRLYAAMDWCIKNIDGNNYMIDFKRLTSEDDIDTPGCLIIVFKFVNEEDLLMFRLVY